MAQQLTILYRGPLASCNYRCGYCPFAKRQETAEELSEDRRALARFCDWVAGVQRPIAVFFTPWGEALVRPWYREAVASLSRLSHVAKVAVQTNLACSLDWLDGCNCSRLGLWCTYHPREVPRERFLANCRRLDAAGVRYSVGMVGLRESLDEARSLRRELPPHVYLWINAYKDVPQYYSEEDIRGWEAIDPHFRTNLTPHASLGRRCRAGADVISVAGDGTIRRCHFAADPIGNLYRDGFTPRQEGAACPQTACGCHIGYVHLEELGLYAIFGDGVLERVPVMLPRTSQSALRVP